MKKNNYRSINSFEVYCDESRGTNSKEWLIDKDGTLYLFKQTQIKLDGTSTNSHFSESIYSDIANLLKVDCVKPEIVTRNFKIGIITKSFLNDNEELIDFNALIQNIRMDYKPKTLKCKKTKEYYSLPLILEAIKAIDITKEEFDSIRRNLIEQIIIDALCDHYDRNASNIGIIKKYGINKDKRYKLSPIFDNGTSLSTSLPLEVVKKYVDNPFGLLEVDKQINSKIGIGDTRFTTYDILLDYIFKNYIEDCIDIIDKINYIIDEQTLNIILNQEKYKGLHEYYKTLILKKVLFNKNKINRIYSNYSKTKNGNKKELIIT